MSIKIQLDEHTVEDYKSIKMLKELGFTDEEIQALYDKQKEIDARKRREMTKQEFIEKAISNGVDNDSKNVWVIVDGYKYITAIDDELDYNDEDQPYMASCYLETYTVSGAWDDLYEQYCCREGVKVC